MRRGRTRGATSCCFHITHRCQERRWLLKFEIDRRRYVERLREGARKYNVDVLDYVVTSNHVHLLLWVRDTQAVSAMMQYVQGAAGRDYNRRKKREGAFWRDRYHPTLIQNGEHLARCLFYIDLNMVRAKAVTAPAEWRCAGYHELCGDRQRYRVLNRARLCQCLGRSGDLEGFEQWYTTTLAEKLACGYHAREPLWSECVAVGDKDWVVALAKGVRGVGRQIVRSETVEGVAEGSESYGLKVGNRARYGLAARLHS